MRRLRHYAIYRLPGIARPVYPILAGGKFHLYDFKFGLSVPPRFVIEDDGHLVNWHGDQMTLTVEDLIETGDTYDQMKMKGGST
jgi:hypothetical protein